MTQNVIFYYRFLTQHPTHEQGRAGGQLGGIENQPQDLALLPARRGTWPWGKANAALLFGLAGSDRWRSGLGMESISESKSLPDPADTAAWSCLCWAAVCWLMVNCSKWKCLGTREGAWALGEEHSRAGLSCTGQNKVVFGGSESSSPQQAALGTRRCLHPSDEPFHPGSRATEPGTHRLPQGQDGPNSLLPTWKKGVAVASQD